MPDSLLEPRIDLPLCDYFDALVQPAASLCACSAVTTVCAVDTCRNDAGSLYKAL